MPEGDKFLAELEGQASSSKPQKPDKATKAEEKRESKKQGNMRRKKEKKKSKRPKKSKQQSAEKNRTRRKVAARSGASLQLPRQQNGCELEENELIAGCGIENHTGGNEAAPQAQWLER